MKKNVMMRTASALLVLVLLTTCIISGTFAKYITSAEGSDSARVAYWGFDKAASIDIDLFDGEYKNADNKTTVKSSNNENVIAPGTSKTTEFSFGYGYKNYQTDKIKAPEVAYEFSVTPDITGNYASLDANPNFKWTLKVTDDKNVTTATTYNTVDDLLKAIKKLSGDATGNTGVAKYNAGELPAAFANTANKYEIGWVWEFKTTDDDPTTTDIDERTAQDATDTAMGNADTLGNITFKITVTATQID